MRAGWRKLSKNTKHFCIFYIFPIIQPLIDWIFHAPTDQHIYHDNFCTPYPRISHRSTLFSRIFDRIFSLTLNRRNKYYFWNIYHTITFIFSLDLDSELPWYTVHSETLLHSICMAWIYTFPIYVCVRYVGSGIYSRVFFSTYTDSIDGIHYSYACALFFWLWYISCEEHYNKTYYCKNQESPWKLAQKEDSTYLWCTYRTYQ